MATLGFLAAAKRKNSVYTHLRLQYLTTKWFHFNGELLVLCRLFKKIGPLLTPVQVKLRNQINNHHLNTFQSNVFLYDGD